ncbi:Uncharacterised protein [uncultured archaeon]|nr:Uncharacterised protein [uncultured archaeon]
MRLTWDFDNSLRNHDGTDIEPSHRKIKKQIAEGHEVSIVTRRHEDDIHSGFDGDDVEKYVKEKIGNIPVHFDDSELKYKTLDEMGVHVHYDDDPKEIEALKKHTNIKGILVTDGKGVDTKKTEVQTQVETQVKTQSKTFDKDKKYGDKIAIVYDFGTFISVAHRLAQDFGKVYYFTPWVSGFPYVKDTSIGSGFPDFERIDNFWDYADEADLIYFPEVSCGDVQKKLVALGKNVWGSRGAEILEMKRMFWIEKLKELGLETPETREFNNLEELIKILKEEEDLYVKLDDMFRGEFETFHHVTWSTTRGLIEKVRYHMGALAERLSGIIQKPIKSKLEFGFDIWFTGGKFPSVLPIGYEIKDLGYVCKIDKWENMPSGVLAIMEKIAPLLQSYGYRGSFSAEIRHGDDGKWYFTDPCLRNANPASFILMDMCDNFSEIVYEGSQGKTVPPIWNSKYGVEVTINSEFLLQNYGELNYPKELGKKINRMNAYCDSKGCVWNVPDGVKDSFGSVIEKGNDIDDMLKAIRSSMDKIKGYKVEINPTQLEEAAVALKKN